MFVLAFLSRFWLPVAGNKLLGLEVEPGIIVCLLSDFNVPQIQVINDPLQVPVSAGFALEVGRAEERVNNGRLAPEHKMKNVNTAFSAFFVRSDDV